MKNKQQINEIAHVIAKSMGWVVSEEVWFNISSNPRAVMFWNAACAVYEHQKKNKNKMINKQHLEKTHLTYSPLSDKIYLAYGQEKERN